jgi:hypothetical protein
MKVEYQTYHAATLANTAGGLKHDTGAMLFVRK